MEYLVFFLLVAAFLLFVFIKGALDARKEKKKFIRSLYENYGQLPKREYAPGKLEQIANFYRRHPKEGQLDDITWNDLNLDDVFKKVNYTYTSAGEEYLYYTLKSPSLDGGELARREAQIQYFVEHPDERVELQMILAELGYSGKYSIYDYIDNLHLLGNRSNLKHYIADLLFLPTLLLCVMKPSLGLVGLVAIIIYNFMSYFKEKK